MSKRAKDPRAYMHEGYVQTIQTGGYFAVCPSCGSDMFPDRASYQESAADVAAHLVERTRIWNNHLREIGAVS